MNKTDAKSTRDSAQAQHPQAGTVIGPRLQGRSGNLVPATWITIRMTALALLLYGSLLPYGSYFQVSAAVLLAPAVIFEIMRPLVRRAYLHDVLVITLLLFSALLVPAVIHPTVGEYGADKVLDLATLSLFTALAASLVRDELHLRRFAQVWCIVGLVISLTTFIGGVSATGRAIGAGANPIGIARGTATAVIAVSWLALAGKIRPPAALFLGSLFSLTLFATGSKGPTIGAVLAVAYLMIFDSQRRALRTFQFTALTAIGIAATATIPFLRNSRLGEFILNPTAVEDQIRGEALAASWAVIRDQGTGGFGYGSWSWITGTPVMSYPHNIWAELAVEAGIWSALAVTLIVGTVLFRLVSKAHPLTNLVFAWTLAETVSASLSGDVRARAFWFFVALGFAVSRWHFHRCDSNHPVAPTIHSAPPKGGKVRDS